MDILFPGIGEIVGGSQREERLEVLEERMASMGIDDKELWWYKDLRKYGSAVHSGFGLGFERFGTFYHGHGKHKRCNPLSKNTTERRILKNFSITFFVT
jgi:asparaginyl-tRNA synthetase